MLLSSPIVDFYLFYDGAVDIQILAILTRSQHKVSDTKVTVKFLFRKKIIVYKI